MISCGMKRSVRKIKGSNRQQGAAWIKNIGTAERHTKSQLSGRNGKKCAAIAAAKT